MAAAAAVIAVYGPPMSVRMGLLGQTGRTEGRQPPSPSPLQPGIKVHCYAHEIVSTHGSVSVHEVPPPPPPPRVAVVSSTRTKQ